MTCRHESGVLVYNTLQENVRHRTLAKHRLSLKGPPGFRTTLTTKAEPDGRAHCQLPAILTIGNLALVKEVAYLLQQHLRAAPSLWRVLAVTHLYAGKA